MVLAPLLVGLATLLAVWAVIPQTSGKPVVVAAKNLAAGEEITSADLDVRTYPPALIPDSAHNSIDAVVGAHAAGALSAGAPITDDSLLEKGTAPEGTVLVPVPAADPAAASIIQTGSRVRIYSAQGDFFGEIAGFDTAAGADAGAEGGTSDENSGKNGGGAGSSSAKDLAKNNSAVVQSAVVTGVSRPSGGAFDDGKLILTLAVTPDEAARLATIPPDMLSFAIVQ